MPETNPKLTPKPLLVSGPRARELLGVATTKYWHLWKSGELETVILGKRRMVSYASIERLVSGGSRAA